MARIKYYDAETASWKYADTMGSNVKPVVKSDDMTQAVGVDDMGCLWTAPSGGGSETWERINQFSITENAMSVSINKDADGNSFKLRKMLLYMYLPDCKDTNGTSVTTGYAHFKVNGIQNSYNQPSAGWSNAYFRFLIEAHGDYIYVTCHKFSDFNDYKTVTGVGSYAFKSTNTNGEIRSFLWSIFNPNADKPSAMAGATFDVWGVKA